MDSGSKGQAWVENLRHRFSTFCSEADDIICQDSVKYVRTKLITARENLMHFCSEIVEDVLHDLSVDSPGENGLASQTQEQDVKFPAQKMLSIGIDPDQDGKSCSVNSASTLLSIEPVGTDIQSDGKAQAPAANTFEKAEESKNSFVESQGYELPEDEVTYFSSGSTKAIQSNEELRQILKSPFDICTVCTCHFPITESNQPSCCQKLQESIIMVNCDECYSDSGMNTKVKFCTLMSKMASERSFESASQDIYSETDRMTETCCTELTCAKGSRIVNEDFCDWEII